MRIALDRMLASINGRRGNARRHRYPGNEGFDLSAPDHTTLSRRGQHLDLPLPPQDRIGLERRGVNPNGVALDLNRTEFLGDLITWEDGVMGRPSRFSPEVRERAVRMVEEHREAHASEWAVLQSVAPKLGCTAETLRKWVRQAQRDAGHRPGLTTSERERLKELEREVRELKRANEILRKASAYFAQAELDRRGK